MSHRALILDQRRILSLPAKVRPTFNGKGFIADLTTCDTESLMNFAMLHVLALHAVLCGSDTSREHAILRCNPLHCLFELIEHCTYAVHASHLLARSSRLRIRERSGVTSNMILSSCRASSMALSLAIAIFFMQSLTSRPWTNLISWVYTHSLGLIPVS